MNIFPGAILASGGSTVEEYLTHNLKEEGSNPDVGKSRRPLTQREKMTIFFFQLNRVQLAH
jgi:hypothetical protein